MPFDQQLIKDARILIIDRDAENAQALTALLSGDGYSRVESESDAVAAVKRYRAQPYDLMLTELSLAGNQSGGLMEELRAHSGMSLLPVMVMAPHSDGDDIVQAKLDALEAGATDFLHMPFDHVDATIRIRNMLHAQMLQQYVKLQHTPMETALGAALEDRVQALEETRLEVVKRLGVAANFKDNETGQHVERMSLVAAILARAAGMTDEEADLVRQAAPMHDIGKIGISDNILLKPGELNEEERVIMQGHTHIGAEILGKHEWPLMHMARVVALTHHEKWDGTGYPTGLKGDEIPLVGRICAIADVFDALTSNRPYKEGWVLDDAFAYIKRHAGTHFDPELVEKFLECRDEIAHIRETMSDRKKP